MLQLIREFIQGWIAIAFVAVISVPFMFWGINYYFDSSAEAATASVNGSDISLREYQRALQTVRQRWQSMTGSAPEGEQEALLRRQTLEGLVQRRLLREAAESLGVRISDDAVRGKIHSLEAFQGFDGFDSFLYQTSLSTLGMTATAFEEQIRDDLAEDQLQSALVTSVFVTDEEVRFLASLYTQSRDFQYAVLSSDAIKEGIEVTAADIEGHYRMQAADYMEPERVRIAYIDLSIDRIAEGVTTSEEELATYYERNIASYSMAEQRRIRQLVVPLPEDAAAEHADAAKDLVEALRQEILSGKSMEDLANDKPGEELPVEFTEFGYLTRGVLDPEIEEAAFAMQEEELSQPLRSKFGYHLIEVMGLRGGDIPRFEDLRAEVEQDYRQAEAERRYFELVERLATLAFEHPDSLEPAAEDIELPVRESGLISREDPGTGVTGDPKVVSAAFSEEILLERNNSDLIELDFNHVVVLRVTEHIPARVRPLEEVQDRIITRIRFERAREVAAEQGREILAQLEAGADLEKVASNRGLTWDVVAGMRRDDPGVTQAILRTAFRAGRPQPGRPVFEGTSLGSGDYAVVVVTNVEDPAAESISSEDIEVVREELLRRHAEQGWGRFLADLRAGAKINIYEENLRPDAPRP